MHKHNGKNLTALFPEPPTLTAAASVPELATIHLDSVALYWLRVLTIVTLTTEVELEPLELEEKRLLPLEEPSVPGAVSDITLIILVSCNQT